MAKFEGGMVSMELDDEDKMDMAVPTIADQPDYPWGLRISLTSKEMAKLGIDMKDASIGDCFMIKAIACVTSLSSNDGPDGPCDRLEAQIQQMAVPDMEDGGDGY